jgi:hypothetical protein
MGTGMLCVGKGGRGLGLVKLVLRYIRHKNWLGLYWYMRLTLSQLMFHICGVSKTFGELYQKTIKREYTNKLILLAFKIIAILHNTRLATLIKLLETVSKTSLGIDKRTAVIRSCITV